MWKKAGVFFREHVIGWARELFTRPKTMAALLAGVLLAFGVNPQLAKQIAEPLGAIVAAIETSQQADSLPPVVEGVPIIPNKKIRESGQ